MITNPTLTGPAVELQGYADVVSHHEINNSGREFTVLEVSAQSEGKT